MAEDIPDEKKKRHTRRELQVPRRSVDVTKIAPCICVSDGAANLGESGLVGIVVVCLCIQIVVMWEVPTE